MESSEWLCRLHCDLDQRLSIRDDFLTTSDFLSDSLWLLQSISKQKFPTWNTLPTKLAKKQLCLWGSKTTFSCRSSLEKSISWCLKHVETMKHVDEPSMCEDFPQFQVFQVPSISARWACSRTVRTALGWCETWQTLWFWRPQSRLSNDSVLRQASKKRLNMAEFYGYLWFMVDMTD